MTHSGMQMNTLASESKPSYTETKTSIPVHLADIMNVMNEYENILLNINTVAAKLGCPMPEVASESGPPMQYQSEASIIENVEQLKYRADSIKHRTSGAVASLMSIIE